MTTCTTRERTDVTSAVKPRYKALEDFPILTTAASMSGPRNLERYANPGPVYRCSDFGEEIIGALFLACLAYGEASDQETRLKIAFKLIARGKDANGWLGFSSPIGVNALPIDRRKLRSGFGRLESRVQKRIAFGYLILEPIMALERGELPRRTWGDTWNRAETIRDAIVKDDLGDIRNFERDYWRPAVPVAHLAAALVVENITLGKGGGFWDLNRFITDPSYAAPTIARAEQFEKLVVQIDVGIPADVLIKIRGQS